MPSFMSQLRSEPPDEAFRYINAPFNFNSKHVASYPQEITGKYLIDTLCRRLGWGSLSNRRLLDFGCGVRFAQTIYNLRLDLGHYAGVDTNREAIDWLKANATDPRMRFDHLDMRNPMYNPTGPTVSPDALTSLGLSGYDGACMFSVITHQQPDDAALIFAMLRRSVKPGGLLYFTAFVDEAVAGYTDRDPSGVNVMSTYNPERLLSLVNQAGWSVRAAFEPSPLQVTAIVCQ